MTPLRPLSRVSSVLASPLGAAFLCLVLGAAPARAAGPEEHFRLSAPLLQKMKAAAPELKKLEKPDGEDEAGAENDGERAHGGLTVEQFTRKIEAAPRARAVLAKHGLGAREFALATYALVHAGMFVGLEPSMDKQQAAAMLASFTSEQKANIALLRKSGPLEF